jgi:arylsulfatase
LDFVYDGGGVGKGGSATLLLDGEEVAKGRIPETVPTRFSMNEGLEIGRDAGMPVSKDYQIPFYFTGEIAKVVIRLE